MVDTQYLGLDTPQRHAHFESIKGDPDIIESVMTSLRKAN